jgi:hypothetical protein
MSPSCPLLLQARASDDDMKTLSISQWQATDMVCRFLGNCRTLGLRRFP